MKTKILIINLIYFSLGISSIGAQIRYNAEINLLGGSGTFTSFWMQNNRFDQFGKEAFQGNIRLSAFKDLKLNHEIFDWGAGTELVAGFSGSILRFIPLQYYTEAKLWIFDALIGAKKQYSGEQDPNLSSGGLIWSTNARPIPQLTAGIFNYTALPFTRGNFEIKGLISHGWFTDNSYGEGVLLHNKQVFIRLGGGLPVKISYGLEHVVQWGGVVPGIGEQKVTWENFWRVFRGQSGDTEATSSDQVNTLGSHIMSQQMNLELDLNKWKAAAYWHNISEDKPVRPIWRAVNWRDGLWGIRFNNKEKAVLEGITVEYFCTLDRSGPWGDKDGIVYGGDDPYFANIYDWAFYNRTIGSPLILSPVYNQPESPEIIMNALRAYHVGINGSIREFHYKLLSTFARYYPQVKLPYKDQKFILLEVFRNLGKNRQYKAGISLGADIGPLTGNNFSAMCIFSISGEKLLKAH